MNINEPAFFIEAKVSLFSTQPQRYGFYVSPTNSQKMNSELSKLHFVLQLLEISFLFPGVRPWVWNWLDSGACFWRLKSLQLQFKNIWLWLQRRHSRIGGLGTWFFALLVDPLGGIVLFRFYVGLMLHAFNLGDCAHGIGPLWTRHVLK